MFELNNGRTTCRIIGEKPALATARTMAKRWNRPVTVFMIRKRDGKKQFLRKVK